MMAKSDLDLCSKPVSEWAKLIDEWIYSERDREILKIRMLDGICYEPLAEEFDLSVRQIKRICQDNIDQLINHI